MTRTNLIKSLTVLSLTALCLLMACTSRPTKPTSYSSLDEEAPLFPDYKNVVVPPNIAPLNFMVQDSTATAFVTEIKGGDITILTSDSEEGKMCFDSTEWHSLLQQNRGKTLDVDVYAQRAQGWVKYKTHHLEVANEDIDAYLSYRLIEPGYELYRQLGLYQRNLTNFDEVPIYENNRTFDDSHNHCINCHNYRNYSTDSMLFHVRATHGGTVIIQEDKAHKIGIKHDSILAAGVYPSWHPTLPLIAFSSNKTGQVFHMRHAEKIEVIDEASDLILYDVEKNTVQNIIRSTDYMETFPCWTPDGTRLYYCSAKTPYLSPDNTQIDLVNKQDSLLYNIYSMSFDLTTRTFGEPRLEVDAVALGGSASVPRVSPDGQWLLFTLGSYGQFHIWHKTSDLWVKRISSYGQQTTDNDQQQGCTPLTAANSDDVDSYHTWSSNGRWIVFSSRRDDGNYTRPYIAYFDPEGHDHKAFMLPQEDPEHSILLLKSYNVPELTRNAVQVSRSELHRVVYDTEADNATYVENP